jgi:hypothetical protein
VAEQIFFLGASDAATDRQGQRAAVAGKLRIEGTRFPVREAGRIIFENERPAPRPKDSHDLLSTYHQLANLGSRLTSSVTSPMAMGGFPAS